MVAGPETGRLYLLGNRPGKEVVCPDLQRCKEQDAVVVVLDPDGGRVLENRTVREAGGKAWTVYRAAVSPDESLLYVAYHGDTQGVDRATIAPDGLDRCAAPASTSPPSRPSSPPPPSPSPPPCAPPWPASRSSTPTATRQRASG